MSSSDNATNAYIEQPGASQADQHSGPSIGFFAVGMIINLVLLAGFFIWAFRQWGKSAKRDD